MEFFDVVATITNIVQKKRSTAWVASIVKSRSEKLGYKQS